MYGQDILCGISKVSFDIPHKIHLWGWAIVYQLSLRFTAINKAVNFLQNHHNRHPLARPLGWAMGCLLWVQALIYILPKSLQCCMHYRVILDRAIKAPHCTLEKVLTNLHQANERWRYKVMPSLIGWVQTSVLCPVGNDSLLQDLILLFCLVQGTQTSLHQDEHFATRNLCKQHTPHETLTNKCTTWNLYNK